MPRRFLTGDPVLITRRRAVTAFAILTIVYVFQGAVLGCAIQSNRNLARQGKQAHDASCARKRNITARVDETWSFLDSGSRIPGVSDALIIRGIRRDIEEFDSLSAVKCDPPVAPPRRPPLKPKETS